jgi:hypothetical protein
MSNLTPEYIQSARSAGSFPIIFNVQIWYLCFLLDVSTESVFPELPGNLGTEFFDSAVQSEFNAANFDAEFWKRDAEDDGSSEHLQKKRRGQTVRDSLTFPLAHSDLNSRKIRCFCSMTPRVISYNR